MKRSAIIFVALLGLMELISWGAYRAGKTSPLSGESDETSAKSSAVESGENHPIPDQESDVSENLVSREIRQYPLITIEEKNGRTERTIHMGVRQYAWDPATLTVKKGELVRLVIHNADVKHGLVIPDLGVDQDIPPEGAVVEFVPEKAGTFEFFCSVWCGEGHMEMRGRITVEEE